MGGGLRLSGMFAYAMVTGVRRGWLDEETHGPAARNAWLALVGNLDENYNLVIGSYRLGERGMNDEGILV